MTRSERPPWGNRMKRILLWGALILLVLAAGPLGGVRARDRYDPDRNVPPGGSSIDVRIPLRYVQPLPEPRVSTDPNDRPVFREWGTRPPEGPPRLYLQEPGLGQEGRR